MPSLAKARRLPVVLARRAETAARAKITRIVAEAKRDIALIRRRRADIADAFYDIGEALVRLKRKEVVAAMGCKSFAQLCEQQVGISSSQADRLVDIVTNMTRDEALSVGATKAASLVALAKATPERDTPAQLMRRPDLKKASSRAIERVTAEVRARSASKRTRSTTEERAVVDALAHALERAGVKEPRVKLKAGHRRGEARVEIDIAVADLARLRRALKTVRRTKAPKKHAP